jgi:hypothetical protein
VPHKDEKSPADGHRLTAEEVGARVGAILSDAEREAREIIAAARLEGVDASLPQTGKALEDFTHALERLSARFDAFELATAAQIEDLGRQLSGALARVAAAPTGLAGAPPEFDAEAPLPRSPSPSAAAEESPEIAAARVRAIDLALAGYSREVIADELASSLERDDVDALLADVLVS